MSVDWQTAADRLNRFRSLDADLQHDLAQLAQEQARDDKLAFKLEEGRIYGMRQQYYDHKLKRDLARSLRRATVVEDHW
jgi:hypothetical protein